jgi:hypothetical protein
MARGALISVKPVKLCLAALAAKVPCLYPVHLIMQEQNTIYRVMADMPAVRE